MNTNEDSRRAFDPSDPHASQPVLAAGPPLANASASIVLLHGRGASAEDMLALYNELDAPACAALVPQAAGHTWYPQSFLAPLQANQPALNSALEKIQSLITALLAQHMPAERIVLLGFSQGACLALEYAARHPRRYGAVIGLTGGLIGPPGTPRNYPGAFDATPVFLGSGDPDPHVPFERVEETKTVLTRMGASVDLRRYPGMPHTINDDELQACRNIIRRVAAPARPGNPPSASS